MHLQSYSIHYLINNFSSLIFNTFLFTNNFPMNIHKKLQAYLHYLKLTEKEKKKRIDKAEQDPVGRPNPQKQHVFPEQNFIEFGVKDEKGAFIQLVNYRYLPKEEPRAVIIMLHGLNSHIGHGAHIAHAFANHGYVTVGFDHRGFGRSPGKPGKVASLEQHLEDTFQFVTLMKKEYPKLPFFCMGLSMGGMATYYTTLKHPQMFQGAIMMAPALKNQLGDFVVGLTSVLKKMLPENMKLTKPTYGMASKNPQITEAVKADPCCYKERAHLSTAHMLVNTMDKSPETFKDYNLPFMVVQGGLDKLVNPDVAFELFANSRTPVEDKEILFYPNMWHDIWHEDEIYEIIEKAIKWMDHRLQKTFEK